MTYPGDQRTNARIRRDRLDSRYYAEQQRAALSSTRHTHSGPPRDRGKAVAVDGLAAPGAHHDNTGDASTRM